MLKRTRSVAITLAALLVFGTTACDSFLDVNENPNAPEVARVDVTLPGVLANFNFGVLGSWPAKMSAEWTQQISYNSSDRGFAQYDRYDMLNDDAAQLWERTYGAVLNETKGMMEEAAGTEEWAYHAIAKIMHAWTFSVATDVWGPIPFTEALNVDIRKPRYDDQVTVYNGVLALLAEAREELTRPNFPVRMPGANDLLYGGDLNRWMRLAFVLEAQAHLRMAYAPGENMTTHANAALTALAQGFATNFDDADFRHNDDDGEFQPWYILRQNPAYKASEFYVELLRARTDPRMNNTADQASACPTVGLRCGHPSGTAPGPDNRYSRVADFFARDSMAFSWLSNSQARFMEAEARLIVNGAADADAAYRAGIRANMEKMRLPVITAAAINAYIAARPALETVANPLEEIIREKYIAQFLKFEAWNDYRRTGFPQLTAVPGALTPSGDIPQRFIAPTSEITNNIENLAATGIPTGPSGMDVRVWWAQ